MLSIIRKVLVDALDNIDGGNSNITEDECKQLVDLLSTIGEPRMSKYQACEYLNISRSKFDSLVREGKLPEGRRQAGFKEKFWKKSEIMKYIT
jgi:excisionase family DNA binding protein